MTQLALPLARVFSTDLLEFAQWQGLYLFELGLAVFALACVLALKLPPSDRYRVFEPLDFLTFSLFAAGSAGLAAVLSLGRLLWWTSTPWLGVALAASIVLLCTAAWIEHNRRNPMINTRWLASGDMLRLGLAILLIRLVLSEQSTGAIGFFQTLGLANTQLQTLFALMLLGAVVGVAASAWLINPARVAEHLIIAVAAICIGCFMDADATSLTRPEQMYVSQFLLAFGSTFFIGPAMVAGLGRVIAQPGNLISFIVLFGMAQNMGGLLGSALLGTVQVVREKYHSSQLVEHLALTDPQVAARVQAYAALYGRSIGDPALRQAQGVRALGSVATREANVLAYNDVFLLIGCIAIATGLWILSVLVWRRYLRPPAASPLLLPPRAHEYTCSFNLSCRSATSQAPPHRWRDRLRRAGPARRGTGAVCMAVAAVRQRRRAHRERDGAWPDHGDCAAGQRLCHRGAGAGLRPRQTRPVAGQDRRPHLCPAARTGQGAAADRAGQPVQLGPAAA